MKCSVAAGLLLASSACAVLEVPVVRRDRHNNGRTADLARGLVRRSTADTLETTLFSGIGYVSGGAYYANVTVGTPAQPQTLLVDTGSSDMYLDARTSAACQSSGVHSCQGGTFSSSSSSTYKQVAASPAFNASYGDGATAAGPYGEDTVCMNDICISNVQFGVAETLDVTVGPAIGLLGVGPTDIEATRSSYYANFPQVLVDANVINSRLYSLYLNDYDAVTGSILFGGVDTDKFTGTLQTVDILPDLVTKRVDQFITTVTAMTANVGGKKTSVWSGGSPGVSAYRSDSVSLPVLLDSGSSAWSVPTSYYSAIVKAFTYVDAQSATAPCKYAYSGDSVTVTMNGQVDITVGVSEFLLPAYNSKTGKQETFSNGEEACVFGIIPSAGTGEGFDTMGDAMMRSMYIVYDLDQGQMSIGQANLNSTSSSIKAVPAGAGGISKALGGKNYGSAAPQSYSIAPSASAGSNAVSTAKTTIGTVTGEAAVPTAARVSGQGAAATSSKSAATGVVLPATGWSGLNLVAVVAASAVLGAALMM